MEENNPKQELFPCPYCKRKFIAKSLEIHLKSHTKNNQKSFKPTYNNQAFIDALDKAMAEEEKHSTYKSSKKKVDDSNQAFLEKLESELKKDEEGLAYQPSEKKQKKKIEKNNNNVDQAFLDKLESELKKDEEGIAYQPSEKKQKKKVEKNNNNVNQAFLDKLESELKKEEEGIAYQPSKSKKKKSNNEEIPSENKNKEIEGDNDKEIEKKNSKNNIEDIKNKKEPIFTESKLNEEEKEKINQIPDKNQIVDNNKTDMNQIFLEKLESELKKDEEGIAYQPSEKKQKKKVEKNNNNVNQAFLDKLESELKKEEEGIAYQPSKSKKKKPNNGEGMSSNDAHKAFLERLDQELQKEKENSKYIPSKKKEINDTEDMKKIFLEKVEKEIENDSNKLPEKKQIKDIKKRELEKEKKIAVKEKPAENGELICYLCYKLIPLNNYLNHLKECETNFRRNNLSKDLDAMRPKKLEEIKNKLSTLSTEQIDEYNKIIMDDKDNNVYEPCENCARNILKKNMEEHLKTCKPMEHYSKKKNMNVEKSYDLDKLIAEDQEKEFEMTLVPCEKCGRKFNPERIEKHTRACKGKK